VKRTLALALLVAAGGASAQENTQAHMEGCLIWNRDGAVSVRNECSRPLTLQFMTAEDQQVVSADLPAGGRFTADAVWGQTLGFLFTACPIGYRPSVRFALENKDAIGISLYYCVGGRPSS
jgi:hypothetical protein